MTRPLATCATPCGRSLPGRTVRWLALAGHLAGLAGCLVQFPERLPAPDAEPPDAAGDAATIQRERFDWEFGAFGVVADPAGALHGFEATGATDAEGRVRFGRVMLDAHVVISSTAEEPRSLGNSGFQIELPDIGPLKDAHLVITRNDESGIGNAELVAAEGNWGGPIAIVRYGENQPTGSNEAPVDFRFVRIGAAQDSMGAAVARGGIGSELFSLQNGVDDQGDALPPLVNAVVTSLPQGGFQVLDPVLPLRGIRGEGRGFLAALRYSAISDNPQSGAVVRPLPELWLGTRTESRGPSGRALEGRWRLGGVTLGDDGRWRSETYTLVFMVTEAAVRYVLEDTAGRSVEAGHADAQSGPMLDLGGIVSLTPDGAMPAVRWFGMGPEAPPHLVLWGTDGRLPVARLFFGLRER